MSTYTKALLSGSTNGKGILVTTSGSTGIAVHTSGSGSTNLDEIWLWAANSSSGEIKLTVTWGELTDPTGQIEVTIPGEAGLVLVAPGLLLQNSLLVKAFAGTANVIILHGFVNRISP